MKKSAFFGTIAAATFAAGFAAAGTLEDVQLQLLFLAIVMLLNLFQQLVKHVSLH